MTQGKTESGGQIQRYYLRILRHLESYLNLKVAELEGKQDKPVEKPRGCFGWLVWPIRSGFRRLGGFLATPAGLGALLAAMVSIAVAVPPLWHNWQSRSIRVDEMIEARKSQYLSLIVENYRNFRGKIIVLDFLIEHSSHTDVPDERWEESIQWAREERAKAKRALIDYKDRLENLQVRVSLLSGEKEDLKLEALKLGEKIKASTGDERENYELELELKTQERKEKEAEEDEAKRELAGAYSEILKLTGFEQGEIETGILNIAIKSLE